MIDDDSSSNIEDWSDDKINAAKYAVMKKICDEKGLPYHPSLVAYLDRLRKQREQ